MCCSQHCALPWPGPCGEKHGLSASRNGVSTEPGPDGGADAIQTQLWPARRSLSKPSIHFTSSSKTDLSACVRQNPKSLKMCLRNPTRKCALE